MGPKEEKRDGVVKAVRTVCTDYNGIVSHISALAAGCAVKENSQEIAFDGVTIESTKVSFERLIYGAFRVQDAWLLINILSPEFTR